MAVVRLRHGVTSGLRRLGVVAGSNLIPELVSTRVGTRSEEDLLSLLLSPVGPVAGRASAVTHSPNRGPG